MDDMIQQERKVWTAEVSHTDQGNRSDRAMKPPHFGSDIGIADDDFCPQSGDIWIAIMGMTGTGKSTLISTLVGYDVGIGHELRSRTQRLAVYSCTGLLDRRVWLVDTPGFDDTFRSDVEVLQEIATFFALLYDKNIMFSSILYLHRITDPRMGGAAVKNLELFKSICGVRALQFVHLVTTRWNSLKTETERHEANERETQLAEDQRFFKSLIEHGSRLVRLESSDASFTKALVRSLVNLERRVDLSIQFEMVTERRRLDKTTAGKLLREDQDGQKMRYEQELEELKLTMHEVMEERDNAGIKQIAAEQQEFLEKHKRAMRERKEMLVDFRQLKDRDLRELTTQASTVAMSRAHLPAETKEMADRYEAQQFLPSPRAEYTMLPAGHRHPTSGEIEAYEVGHPVASNRRGSVTRTQYPVLRKGTLRDPRLKSLEGNQVEKVKRFLFNFVT